jgi:hypothetical protein
MLCSKTNDFTIKIQCQTSKKNLESRNFRGGGVRDLGQGPGGMIFSQGGGGVLTPYQHPVAMYEVMAELDFSMFFIIVGRRGTIKCPSNL